MLDAENVWKKALFSIACWIKNVFVFWQYWWLVVIVACHILIRSSWGHSEMFLFPLSGPGEVRTRWCACCGVCVRVCRCGCCGVVLFHVCVVHAPPTTYSHRLSCSSLSRVPTGLNYGSCAHQNPLRIMAFPHACHSLRVMTLILWLLTYQIFK